MNLLLNEGSLECFLKRDSNANGRNQRRNAVSFKWSQSNRRAKGRSIFKGCKQCPNDQRVLD